MTLLTVFTHVLAAAVGSGATFAFVHKKPAAASQAADALATIADAAKTAAESKKAP